MLHFVGQDTLLFALKINCDVIKQNESLELADIDFEM